MKYLSVIELIDKNISGEWGEEPLYEPTIKVIRNTNFTNEGKLNLSDVVERSIPKIKVVSKSLKFGDIIIEKSGGSPNQPVGRVVFYDQKDGEYLFSNFTSALRPRQNVHSRYLFYILYAHHCFKTTLSFQNKTTGILNLQLKRYLEETKIPLPPLETQKKIAAILDKADELRQNDKKILQKYEQLAQSVFLEMFGDPIRNPLNWKVEPLGKLCNIRRGASPRPISDFLGGTVPWIKIGDGTNGDDIYIESTKESITEKGALKSVILEPGSLIFANCGVSLGFARIIKIRGCIHDGWLSFDGIKEEILNKMYLLKLLNSLSEYFRMTAPDGTQPNLNTGIMKKFLVPLPPIEEQKKYEKIISALSHQKKITQQSLQKSDDLFQSLLQRAFRGELE